MFRAAKSDSGQKKIFGLGQQDKGVGGAGQSDASTTDLALLPVVNRANMREMEGVCSLLDVLQAFGVHSSSPGSVSRVMLLTK